MEKLEIQAAPGNDASADPEDDEPTDSADADDTAVVSHSINPALTPLTAPAEMGYQIHPPAPI